MTKTQQHILNVRIRLAQAALKRAEQALRGVK